MSRHIPPGTGDATAVHPALRAAGMLHQGARIIISALILLSGCRPPPPLSKDAIRNAEFSLPSVGKIRFANDEFERPGDDAQGQPSIHIGLIDLFAFGDLDGDRGEDAVTFLAQTAGGPEIFLSMEVFKNDRGGPSHLASHVIGDRVGIDSVRILEGIIDLYVITQGPNDAICCPTLHVNRKLRLQDEKLVVLTESKPL